MVIEKNAHHDEFAREIRSELGYNRITIKRLAEEVGRTNVTISVWLMRNTTQERYDIMKAAIKRIVVAKKEESK